MLVGSVVVGSVVVGSVVVGSFVVGSFVVGAGDCAVVLFGMEGRHSDGN